MQVLTRLSRIFTVVAALCIASAVILPLWRIDLTAPQYPEGLYLQIYASKLGGDVQIINGLNHYIGMRELHEKDFVEFSVLPYLLGGLALLGLVTALINRRKVLYAYLAVFLVFCLLAMYDFYRWEYEYGHNLDPKAAIQVPGMAYQPPLIGFKQLLNFGAWSFPDIGGWMLVTAGALLVVAAILEYRKARSEKS